jgi:hypothetical protein
MSVTLEPLLNDMRHANDGAIAMSRPIIATRLSTHPVQRPSRLHPARTKRFNAAHVATSERGYGKE